MTEHEQQKNENQSTVPAAAQINPYAAKKVTHQIFRKPLEEYDNWQDDEAAVTVTGEDSNIQNIQNNDLFSSTNAAVSSENASASDKAEVRCSSPETAAETVPAAGTKSAPPSTSATTPMSAELPMWKRLPSQNTSFTPAEILTVSEVCLYGHLYVNKSIRLTGVLTHRMYHSSTGEISLVLEDPLAKLQLPSRTTGHRKASTTQKVATNSRRISFGSINTTVAQETTTATTSSSSSTATTKNRPSLGMTGNRITTTPSLSSRGTPGTTTPTRRNPPTPRTGLIMPGSTSAKFRTPAVMSNNRKRPLSSIVSTKPQKRTQQEALVDALVEGFQKQQQKKKMSVWIVVDPRFVPVDSLAVGDIVTVMGTVQLYRPCIINDETTIIAHDKPSMAVCRTGDLILQKQRQQQQTTSTPKMSTRNNDSISHSEVLWIQARIARQDNGANLRLQQEALMLRREHLLTTIYTSRIGGQSDNGGDSSNNHNNNNSTKLLLGCGPPPYNHNDNNGCVSQLDASS